MVIAVCETVGVFNTGAANKANLMNSCGISPGRNMLKERIVFASHKGSSKYRKRRQEIRSKRKSKADKLGHLAQAQNQRQMEKGKEKGRTGNPGKRQRQLLYLLSLTQVKLKLCLWPQNWSLLLPPEKDQKCLIELVCCSI